MKSVDRMTDKELARAVRAGKVSKADVGRWETIRGRERLSERGKVAKMAAGLRKAAK